MLSYICFCILCAPSRFSSAIYFPINEEFKWLELITGIFNDAKYGAVIFSVALILFWIVTGGKSSGTRQRLFRSSVFSVSMFMMLTFMGFAEFKIQRGDYPAFYDVYSSFQSFDMVKGAVNYIFLGRYLTIFVISSVAFWFGIRLLQRKLSNYDKIPLLRVIVQLLIIHVVVFQVNFKLLKIVDRATSNSSISSPISAVIKSFSAKAQDNRFILDTYRNEKRIEAKSDRGARFLGFDFDRVEASQKNTEEFCSQHPLSKPLFQPSDIRLYKLFRELSAVMTRSAGEHQIHITHVIMESFRASDLHAINPDASVAITPFFNDLYLQKESVISANNFHQSGIRTSQGLSATLCGLGALPLMASAMRDFGNLSLRCLPDILKDANYSTRMFYGSNVTFENISGFTSFHAMDVSNESQFPIGLPKGGWGISDSSVGRLMWQDIERKNQNSDSYSLFLTLSHHTPYSPPQDISPEVINRVKKWMAKTNLSINSEELDRLMTAAYSDDVLKQLSLSMDSSEAIERSILIAHADHSTADNNIWVNSKNNEFANQQSRIPFVIRFSKAWFEDQYFAESIKPIVNQINEELEFSSSVNQVPHIILNLLAETKAIRALPDRWKWSTLGDIPKIDSRDSSIPELKIWLVDANSKANFLAANGRVIMSEPSSLMQAQSDEQWPLRHQKSMVDFFGRFILEYSDKCRSEKFIRMSSLKRKFINVGDTSENMSH